jgi:hypothetical protein
MMTTKYFGFKRKHSLAHSYSPQPQQTSKQGKQEEEIKTEDQ